MNAVRERAIANDELQELAAAVLEPDAPAPSIDELSAEGDHETLLALGAAYRTGTPPVARDDFKALECFEAASRLGDADATYLTGVAYMDGIGIGADFTEGAKRLRSAAQRGSLEAKVYVANLYEMGVHYQADREKADVWYRNVERAASIEAEPESHEHDVAMGELGCVRHCLKLVADDALPTKDRAFYLKKAKAMGYHHRLALAKQESASAIAEELEAGEPPAAAQPAPEDEAAGAQKPEAKKPEGEKKPEDDEKPDETKKEAPEDAPALLGAAWTWAAGLLALVPAAFFLCAAAAAGGLAMVGAGAMVEAGHALPQLEAVPPVAVFWTIVVALGVLPATATYRPKVVAIAAALGAAAGAGGHFAWDAQHLLWDRFSQAAALGGGTFLVVLFVLGVLGGTRARGRRPER